jgi:hypothetical protein
MINMSVRLVLFGLMVAVLIVGGVAASRYVGQAVRVQQRSDDRAPAPAPAVVRPARAVRT